MTAISDENNYIDFSLQNYAMVQCLSRKYPRITQTQMYSHIFQN